MINQPYKQIENGKGAPSPGLQFLIFILLFAGVYILGNILGAVIAEAVYGKNVITDIMHLKLTSSNVVNVIWLLQFAGVTLPIFAAPVFFAFVIVRDPGDYLKPTFRFSWLLILLVFGIMFISNPVIEFLSNLNQKMVLPHWLKWMRTSEDDAQKVMNTILQMKTIWSLIFNVLFIGLLTAIVEEFMFRGVLQTIFVRWTKSTHAAVWISAILFSAFHLEFFGFLPRLMLGVLFGYFVAWSGSIWPAVWAHFLNNGTAVVATYLFQHKSIKINPDDEQVISPLGFLFSMVIMLLLLSVYRRIAAGKKQVPE